MNLERFNSIMWDVVGDNEKLNLIPLLQAFHRTFSQNITQPNQPNADAFKKADQALKDVLKTSSCNSFSPSQKAFLDSIKATDFVGDNLVLKLEHIIETNISMPGQAITEVQKHVENTIKFYNQAKIIKDTLEDMEIYCDFTRENEYEVGILFPSGLFNNNLDGLQKEIVKLNRHMKTFGLLAANDASSPTIRAVSNDSLDVFLNALPDVANCIVDAIKDIVLLYLAILQIKKYRLELKEKKVPAKVLAPIETYEKERVSEDLEKIADKLIKDYGKKTEKTKDPELRIALLGALNYLIKRLDQGVDFEVTPPAEFAEPKVDASEKDVQEQQKKREDALRLRERAAIIRELPPREKPILCLTEPDEPEEKSKQ
ncbi:MAG: hypothetical protein ABFD52_05220 [Acidobacteriota bacterium]